LPMSLVFPMGPSSQGFAAMLIRRPVARTHCCVTQSLRYPDRSPSHITTALCHETAALPGNHRLRLTERVMIRA